MSRYASAAYILAAEDHQLDEKRMALVKIDLVTPSAKSLFLSTHDVKTPDGQLWEGILDNCGPIEARSELLSEGPDLAVCPVRIARRKVGFQVDNAQTVLDLFNQYEWQGAAVTIYSWIEGLPAFSDALSEFVGTIGSYTPDPDGVELQCKQGTAWAASFPDLFVNTTTFPGAPESIVGRVLPVIIGDRRAEGLRFRSPFIGGYDDHFTKKDQTGGGSLVDAGVVVDTGRHSGKLVVVYAAHPLTLFGQRGLGANLFMRGGDFLAEIDPIALVIENDASGARITVASDQLIARTGVMPPDINHAQENPLGAISACDIFGTDTYAEMNNTAPNRQLDLVLPAATPLGMKFPGGVAFCIAYSTAATSNALRIFPRSPGGGVEGLRVTLPATSGIEVISVVQGGWPQGGINGPWYGAGGDAWNFGGGFDALHPTIDLAIDFAASSANNRARVFWVGLSIPYIPQRSVINPGYSPGRTSGFTDVTGRRRTGQPRPGEVGFGQRFLPAIGAVTEIQSDFFHNSMGYADDGSGTYTGTASALIERPCDVARLLLVRYGGVPGGLIETGVGVLGSFVDARTAHRTIDGNLMAVARCVDQTERVSEAVAGVARETAAICFISRRTGKYNWIPWDIDAPANYDKALTAADILDGAFFAERQSESLIINQIRVRYGQDAFRGGTLHNTFITPGVSGGGFSNSGRRDQNLTVVASVSDRLDFNVTGTGTVAASLTPGDYTGATGMQHVRTQMKAVGGATDILVQWGFEVVVGYNDYLPVAGFTITIAPGSYASGQLLAAQVQTQLNAAGTGLTWTVTYGPGGVFTFAATGSFVLDWTRGGAANVSAALLFGFDPAADTASSPTATGAISCFAETFRIARAGGTISLYPDSGTNKARSAWPLLGFDPLWDRPAVSETATRIYTAYARAGIRERQATASKTAHGARPELTLDTQWLNGTQMAGTLRDRVFDWRVEQPVRIRFSTLRMPDIDRGMIFPLDASLDMLLPYPRRDGVSSTWAGRKAMVLEVRRDLAGKHIEEVVAIEVARVANDGPSTQPAAAIGIAVGTTPSSPALGVGHILFADNRLDPTTHAGFPAQNWVAKLNADGTIPWTANGVAVGAGDFYMDGNGEQSVGDVLSMPDGGCIVAFGDQRSATFKLYAQRYSASGAAMWGADKVLTTTTGLIYYDVNIVDDGAGGAVVVWTDTRDGASASRIFAQRLDASGNQLWTANGVRVTSGVTTTSDTDDVFLRVFRYPGGGTWIAWVKTNNTSIYKLYVQALTMDGLLMFATGGLQVGTGHIDDHQTEPGVGCIAPDGRLMLLGSTDAQNMFVYFVYPNGTVTSSGIVDGAGAIDHNDPLMCSDGLGGCYLFWLRREPDTGSGFFHYYVRRVSAGGVVQWTAPTNVRTDTATGGYFSDIYRAMCADGSGNCFVCFRSKDTSTSTLWIAKITPTGVVSWMSSVTTATPGYVRIKPDAQGGAIVSFGGDQINVTGTGDIKAQRFDATGAALWTAGGVTVCAASGEAFRPWLDAVHST